MASSTQSNYITTKQMDRLLLGVDWTPPTSIWVALFTSVPNLDGTSGVEVSTSGTGYGRKEIVQGSSGWNGASGSALTYSNVNDIVFDTPTQDWGTVRGFGLYDAEVDGNLLYVGYLSTSKTVAATDNAPRILANQLRISRATC